MNTMSLESWCKPKGFEQSIASGVIGLRINDDYHLTLEQEAARLEKEGIREKLIPIETGELEMTLPSELGEISDCSLRLYLDEEHRGHFHLVAHRASDDALIYTNAVMVEQLD